MGRTGKGVRGGIRATRPICHEHHKRNLFSRHGRMGNAPRLLRRIEPDIPFRSGCVRHGAERKVRPVFQFGTGRSEKFVGGGRRFGAIRLTQTSSTGAGKQRRNSRTEPRPSCLYRRGPTQNGFTNTFGRNRMYQFNSCVDGSGLADPNRTHRFQVWL